MPAARRAAAARRRAARPVAALLGCAVLTGYGAVTTPPGVRPGESVAVFGLGGVGLAVLQSARIAGAGTIIAVDVRPEKEELARAQGATEFLLAGDGHREDDPRADRRFRRRPRLRVRRAGRHDPHGVVVDPPRRSDHGRRASAGHRQGGVLRAGAVPLRPHAARLRLRQQRPRGRPAGARRARPRRAARPGRAGHRPDRASTRCRPPSTAWLAARAPGPWSSSRVGLSPAPAGRGPRPRPRFVPLPARREPSGPGARRIGYETTHRRLVHRRPRPGCARRLRQHVRRHADRRIVAGRRHVRVRCHRRHRRPSQRRRPRRNRRRGRRPRRSTPRSRRPPVPGS